MIEVESFAEGRVETELMNHGAQSINEQEKNIGTQCKSYQMATSYPKRERDKDHHDQTLVLNSLLSHAPENPWSI